MNTSTGPAVGLICTTRTRLCVAFTVLSSVVTIDVTAVPAVPPIANTVRSWFPAIVNGSDATVVLVSAVRFSTKVRFPASTAAYGAVDGAGSVAGALWAYVRFTPNGTPSRIAFTR